MGGRGSTRWRGHRPARIAWHCRIYNVEHFRSAGAWNITEGRAGTLRWESGFAVEYTIRTATGGSLAFFLSYRIRPPRSILQALLGTAPAGPAEQVTMAIRLEMTPTPRGKGRWWMRCPLLTDGVPCGRRVLHLYLPDGARYFGCRRCHRLTYMSAQTSHGRLLERALLPLARLHRSLNTIKDDTERAHDRTETHKDVDGPTQGEVM